MPRSSCKVRSPRFFRARWRPPKAQDSLLWTSRFVSLLVIRGGALAATRFLTV